MDNIIKGLKKLVPFKDTLEAGDIVLIAAKKPQMLVYGLVSDIGRDDTKRHLAGLAARQDALQRFSLNSMVEKYTRLYQGR